DTLRLDDGDGEAALHAPLHPRRQQVLRLRDVAGVDLVARRDVRENAPSPHTRAHEAHECQPDYSLHWSVPPVVRREIAAHGRSTATVDALGPTPRRR